MRLLLVDGDRTHRTLLRDDLARVASARCEFFDVGGAEEARHALAVMPHCALVVTREPARDLAPVLDALRDEAGELAAPVVALVDGDRALGEAALALGAREYVSVTAARADGVERVVGGVLERARLARSLRECEESLSRAERRREQILTRLAHEVLNPLAAIRNVVAIMRRIDYATPSHTRGLDVIERQLNDLKRIVDDVLDLSRVTQGKLALRRGVVDLADVLARSVETCQAQLDARRHVLRVSLPATPILVQGDRTRLTQIVTNLLHNAAKYTDDGGRITLTLSQAPGSLAKISVRDNGLGVDGETLPRLFDPFFQAERSRARADGGLGVGLSLVHSLAELHGGSVTAQSEGLGKGSEFVVLLPCAEATLAAPIRRTTAPALRCVAR